MYSCRYTDTTACTYSWRGCTLYVRTLLGTFIPARIDKLFSRKDRKQTRQRSLPSDQLLSFFHECFFSSSSSSSSSASYFSLDFIRKVMFLSFSSFSSSVHFRLDKYSCARLLLLQRRRRRRFTFHDV